MYPPIVYSNCIPYPHKIIMSDVGGSVVDTPGASGDPKRSLDDLSKEELLRFIRK